MHERTFIIDCPSCKAKVAAIEKGRAESSLVDEESGYPSAERILLGSCPRCTELLVGRAYQTAFAGVDSDEDYWSDAVRIYPEPAKTFFSHRIPAVVRDSLEEAERSLQANANIACCAMLGRALEALCRDVLKSGSGTPPPTTGAKEVMLAEGIKRLKEQNIIDERLYDWSQQLHAFRNMAAHPEDVSISRQDAQDLQTFVHAIIDYIYDLTDRYNEFKERVEEQKKKKPKRKPLI
jgi:hypothetical protein